MPDRETWITAVCYWIVSLALLLGDFVWRRTLPVVWPIVAVLAVLAMPLSLALALYGRRTEGRRAQEQASLRAENRFEEAAEWQTDGFYVGWTVYWLAQVAVAVVLIVVGIVLAMPVLMLGGLGLAAYPLWCAYDTRISHKADLEHRRTSKERITASTDALEDSGWDRRPPGS